MLLSFSFYDIVIIVIITILQIRELGLRGVIFPRSFTTKCQNQACNPGPLKLAYQCQGCSGGRNWHFALGEREIR